MESNDDILFDRLVDGELPSAERSALLSSLDAQPDGWRRCALAFLEAQAWRQASVQLVLEANRPSEVTSSSLEHKDHSRNQLHWLVLAASVFIAFTLGLAFGDLPHPTPTATSGSSNSMIAESAPQSESRELPRTFSPNDALTLWARDESGRAHPLRVPLVDAAALDRQLGSQFPSNMPANVRDQLHQRGYQVESKQRYAPLWLDNGRPLILPVEDAKIVPVSNAVY